MRVLDLFDWQPGEPTQKKKEKKTMVCSLQKANMVACTRPELPRGKNQNQSQQRNNYENNIQLQSLYPPA